MKQLKNISLVIIAVVVIGAISFTSFQYLGADAAKSPNDNLPLEKKEQEDWQERKMSAARAQNEKKPEGNPGPSKIQIDSPIITEILDFVDDPLRNKVILFTNGWISSKENGKSVSVGAGSLVEDPEQGVLLIRQYDEKRSMVEANIINTPDKSGRVTIKEFNKMILTLVTEDGKELIFNVESEKFN